MKVFHSALLRWSVDLCQVTDVHLFNTNIKAQPALSRIEVFLTDRRIRSFEFRHFDHSFEVFEAEFKRLQEAFAGRACQPTSPAFRNERTEE